LLSPLGSPAAIVAVTITIVVSSGAGDSWNVTEFSIGVPTWVSSTTSEYVGLYKSALAPVTLGGWYVIICILSTDDPPLPSFNL
jgi:hypothetical protein